MITKITVCTKTNEYNPMVYKKCKPKNFAFTSKISSISFTNLVEIVLNKTELAEKKLKNRFLNLFNKKQIDLLYGEIANLDENTKEYIEKIVKLGRYFTDNKTAEINLESNCISNIAQSNEPCIFIMNHDNRRQDTKLLNLFNTLLNMEYLKLGNALNCPRPKIIINETILLSKNKKEKNIYEKLGAVGVDSRILQPSKTKNAKNLFPTIRSFINNKVNIFIFPEGKNGGFKKNSLQEKFQLGVAEIIHKAIQYKEQVKVIPIGFAYNKNLKNSPSCIHVGKPILFKKHGDSVLSTRGNIDSNFADKNYIAFFNKQFLQKFSTITEQGNPVTGKDLPNYIAGILCENLKICKEEAKNSLSNISIHNKVIEI